MPNDASPQGSVVLRRLRGAPSPRGWVVTGALGHGPSTARPTGAPVVRLVAHIAPMTLARIMLFASLLASPLSAQARTQQLSPDTLFFAEGISADARTGTLYVTSIHHRSVLVVPPHGEAHWLFDAAIAGTAAVTGVVVDTLHALAWITTARHPQMRPLPSDSAARGELLAVRLRDGRVQRRFTLGDGRSIAGELTLTPRGEVLVSDGLRGVLYRLRSGATSLDTVRSAALRSPQGIATDAAGRVAWIADWSRGLLRWDLTTDSITSVPVGHDAQLRGIDGLLRVGDTLLTVLNGATTPRVLALTLNAEGTAITAISDFDVMSTYPGEPTVGTRLGDEYVYVVSSAWPFYTDEGVRRPGPRVLPPVTVRRVPLPRDGQRR